MWDKTTKMQDISVCISYTCETSTINDIILGHNKNVTIF